jgi:tetratricopeptide (TPR) repeat protein
LSYFEKIQPVFQEHNSLNWLSYLYHQKFICYLRLERIEESQELAEVVIDSYKKENNKKGLLGFLLNYSELWQKKQDLAKALHYAKISESMATIYKTHSYFSFIYLRIASIYKDYRFYVRAITYYTKAIELFAKENKKVEQAECWSEKGLIHQEIFVVDEALEAFEEAVKIYLEIGNIDAAIQNLERIRKIHLELGDVVRARSIETEMIKLGKKKL